MGGRCVSFAWWVAVTLSALGCEQPEPVRERITIAPADRACEEGDACGVVETNCRTRGCECGVAVHELSLLDYQRELAECRGAGELATCDYECPTPFGKCFKGACVLTEEPPDLVRRGRSVQRVCEQTRGDYVGCPECPPNERCKSCVPCACPSSHRWTSKGCKAVVLTEARDVRIETRPPRLHAGDAIKVRVHNESKRTVWLKTVCGTPFYRVRKKEDAWEVGYEPFHDVKCRLGSVEIKPGKNKPFVAKGLLRFKAPSGTPAAPGTYRFEVTYTDGSKSFRHRALVYSSEFDLLAQYSSR